MYFEQFGFHHAKSRQQALLAEAEHARLVRLARSARSAGGPRAPARSHAVAMAASCVEVRETTPWRRAALWLGTLLVRWGEALQIQAGSREAAPEPSIPW